MNEYISGFTFKCLSTPISGAAGEEPVALANSPAASESDPEDPIPLGVTLDVIAWMTFQKTRSLSLELYFMRIQI